MNSEPSSLSMWEERLDILYRELELAIRWKRPSILFAICRSEYVRDQLMERLAERLRQIGKNTYPIHIKGDSFPVEEVDSLRVMNNVVIFVDSQLSPHDEQHARAAFAQIDRYREYFVDNSLHAVFWLCEHDVQRFVLSATDSWYLRHRVIDFTEDLQPPQLVLETLEEFLQCQGNQCAYPLPASDLNQEIATALSTLTLSPSHTSTLIILGLFCLKQGDFQDAQKFLRVALDLSQTANQSELTSYCLKYLGMAEYGLGEVEKAIDLYKQAIQLSAKPGKLWKNLGMLHVQQHQYQEAIRAFQEAARALPKDADIWRRLGEAYLLAGFSQEALAAFEKALVLDADDEQALTGKGRVLLHQGNHSEAYQCFHAVLAKNPNHAPAWIGIGQVYEFQGKPEEAQVAYQKAVQNDPHSSQAWERLGKLYQAHKDYENAARAFEQRLQIDPESWRSYQDLAQLEYQRCNYGRASYFLEQAIPLCNDTRIRAVLWKQLAQAQARLDNQAIAVQALEQANRLIGANMNSEQAEQKGETGDMLEPTNLFETRSAQEWNELGVSLMRSGNYQKAIYAFTKAIETGPENSWPYIKNMALAHYLLGKQHGSTGALDESEEESDENILPSIAAPVLPSTPRSENWTDGDNFARQSPSATSSPGEPHGQQEAPVPSSPNLAEEWNERGNQSLMDGDFQQAIASYKKAISLDPTFGKAYINLGLAYFRQGNYHLAETFYKKGLEFLSEKEERAIALARLGDVYRRLNDHQNALKAYQEAQSLSSDHNALLERARRSLLTNPIG